MDDEHVADPHQVDDDVARQEAYAANLFWLKSRGVRSVPSDVMEQATNATVESGYKVTDRAERPGVSRPEFKFGMSPATALRAGQRKAEAEPRRPASRPSGVRQRPRQTRSRQARSQRRAVARRDAVATRGDPSRPRPSDEDEDDLAAAAAGPPALLVRFELERRPQALNAGELSEDDLVRIVDWLAAHGLGLKLEEWLERCLDERQEA